jgi:hypothetical protein
VFTIRRRDDFPYRPKIDMDKPKGEACCNLNEYPGVKQCKIYPMEPFYLRFYNWLLVRIPVLPFPLGLLFWYIYLKSGSLYALGACELFIGLFLLMPAWYLTFRSDLGIALFNALYAFLKPRSREEAIRPLFKGSNWKTLTNSERKILAIIAIILAGCGIVLILLSYPILLQIPIRYR